MPPASACTSTAPPVPIAERDLARLPGVLQKIDTAPIAPYAALRELDEVEARIVCELAAEGARALLAQPSELSQPDDPTEE